jgi:hypothetical protein
MIIVRLGGGLGNQMFQYALGKHLSIINKQILKLDASGYTSTEPDTYKDIRIYGLKNFNITAETASADEIGRYFKYYKNKWTRRLWRLSNRFFSKNYYEGSFIEEPAGNYWKFDNNLLDHPHKELYISGYWQTEKYFKDIREVLLKEFTVKPPIDEKNAPLLEDIKNQAAVSLHIRRGNNTDPKNYFGTLSLEYYTKAVKIIVEKVPDPHFYIFSDDTEWAKNNFKIDLPTVYVGNKEAKDYEDIRLMSHCKHHILANSTFSWWGAWLAKNPGQIVIAPERYTQQADIPNPDFYPAGWILL